MSKKEKMEHVGLSLVLSQRLKTKEPFRTVKKTCRDYEVRGPMSVNGVEYPYHLFYRERNEESGVEREIRIAVDPTRRDNGSPIKGSRESKPVLAYKYVRVSTPSIDGELVSVEMHPIRWLLSVVEIPA